MPIIGFSTGCLHMTYSDRKSQEFSNETINLLSLDGRARAIEINCGGKGSFDHILELKPDLSGFEYVSIHAPAEFSSSDIDLMRAMTNEHRIDNFVFHPSVSSNWDLLAKSGLPVSIENMDSRKDIGKNVGEIASILGRYGFGLTLDLQHCFTNEESMSSAREFQEILGDRVVEYHLSGFDSRWNHFPLFKTGQDKIIGSLKNKKAPIIIESAFFNIDEIQGELDHIEQRI